ncbi:DNA damage-responsive transcriptional repressor RPH1 [Vanrija pseudolonga]|uniref:[histone H3]-trimethyl-L-lysine(9) demethylase n=1 Tax=Vanrija pseudolonga TaxID=143232 RepID=A0AAF0Y3V6_9TREE|nr:DNA damage-responsive transcriptional repressor RPH1 [Vanrija pseudolonga]
MASSVAPQAARGPQSSPSRQQHPTTPTNDTPSRAAAAAAADTDSRIHTPTRSKAAKAAATDAAAHAPAPPPPTAAVPPEIAKPHCFFPMNNHPTKSSESEPEAIPDEVYVHPNDDPAALRGIPIFKPTYEEFKDFDVYMEKVLPWGQRSSIVKIIPPQEWVDNVKLIDNQQMSELQIRSPIEQRMVGTGGVFVQQNIERLRSRGGLAIHEWFDKCAQDKYQTPNPKEIVTRTQDRDSKEAKARLAAEAARVKAERAEKKAKRDAAARRKLERRKAKAEEAESQVDVEAEAKPELDAALLTADAVPSVAASPAIHEEVDDLPALEVASHTSRSTAEPLATTPDSATMAAEVEEQLKPVNPFYENTDLHKDWLPQDATHEDFTVQGCANLERKFWRTLGQGSNSWYGADLAGSLFAEEDYPWNVANLPNLLNKLPEKLPGVNSPYLYFGMWRAAFSWHVEDMDLFSINYIHFGAPKFWYAVPQVDAERFESVTKSYFPNDANTCDQFMRHKSCTLSATKLHSSGIRVNKLVQYQNEFVITFPRGYHAGFNVGFNCAESVNFALPCWLELGKKAKACSCVDYSEETPEPVEPTRSRKRKAPGEPGSSSKRGRRPKVEQQAQEEGTPVPERPLVVRLQRPENTISLTKQPKAAVTREIPTYPCVLCPGLETEDLAPVFEPSDHIRSVSKTPVTQAHVSCAVAVPEAFTDEVEVDGVTSTYIKGLDDIGKDRWKLKCSCCPDKRTATMGTKIQCTKGKCMRAYHVSCAKKNPEVLYTADMRIHRVEVPPAGSGNFEDTPVFTVELLCPKHNPAMLELKKRQAQDKLREQILGISPGSAVKIKKNGSSYAALLIEAKEASQTVVVTLPDGSIREVAWSALDLRPNQPQMLENEYAGPPKRSRKVTTAAGPEAQTPFTGMPLTKAPPPIGSAPPPQLVGQASSHGAYYYAQPRGHAQAPGYHGGHNFYQPPPHVQPPHAHGVFVVNSKDGGFYPAQAPPPPFSYGPGPMVAYQGQSIPQVSYHPHRLPVPPPGRLPQYTSPRQPPPHLPPPPAHLQYRSHTMSAAPPSGTPPGPSTSPNQQLRATPLPTPVAAPSGVGKIDLGLDRMSALMAGLPPLTTPAIHLTGTNGKGSVSAILESCLRSAGLRTARYNSPHLLEPRDTVRINGAPPSAEDYTAAVAHVQKVSDSRGLQATVFEIGTAAAFLLANTAQPPADVMIIECGMGGARDATNVMPPGITLASALSSVGLDHTAMLGNTIAAIAREKSSIVVEGGVLVVAPHLHPDALATAKQVTQERRAHLIESAPTTTVAPAGALTLSPFKEPAAPTVRTPLAGSPAKAIDTHLALPGSHQLDNLSLALTILDVLRNDRRALAVQPKLSGLTDERLQAGVQSTRWSGRCSWLKCTDPASGQEIPVLVDGAHNGDSAATLRSYVDSLGISPERPRTFVLSLSSSPGKTPESVLAPLLRRGDRVALVDFTTPVEGMPWVKPVERGEAQAAAAGLVGPTGTVHSMAGSGPAAVAEALRWSVSDWPQQGPGLIVVCGSLYLVADAYRLVGQSA